MTQFATCSIQTTDAPDCAVELMSVRANCELTEHTGADKTGIAFDERIPGQGCGQYLASELIALKVSDLKFCDYQVIFDQLSINFEVWTKPSNYESVNNWIDVRPNFFVTECQCRNSKYCHDCGDDDGLQQVGRSVYDSTTIEHTPPARKYPQ